MAKQIIVLAFIIFFAAVGMAAAQENNNVPAAAANLAPAAAAAGLNLHNTSQLIGALQGAAADGAPIGGPIPEGVFKNLAPGANQPEAKSSSGAAALEATAAAGTIAVASVVGSFFCF